MAQKEGAPSRNRRSIASGSAASMDVAPVASSVMLIAAPRSGARRTAGGAATMDWKRTSDRRSGTTATSYAVVNLQATP